MRLCGVRGNLWIDVRCSNVAEKKPVKENLKYLRVKNSCGITTKAIRAKMRGILKALKLAKDRLQPLFYISMMIIFKDVFTLSFSSLDLWSGVHITVSKSRHCSMWAVTALPCAKRGSPTCSVSWEHDSKAETSEFPARSPIIRSKIQWG